jgi:ribose/xylose/arabinose/galactoside ABC-type transport system permease subunit
LKYPVTEQSTNPTNYGAASTAIGGDELFIKFSGIKTNSI